MNHMSIRVSALSARTAVASLFAFALCLCCLSLLPSPATAGDLNSVTARGDVVRVEIFYQGSTYDQTLIYLADDAPTAQVHPHVFRCDGTQTGLSACASPSTLLPCIRQSETSPDPFISGRYSVSYTCVQPARRDAGACVGLSAHLTALYGVTLLVYSEPDGRYETVEALALDVDAIGVVQSGWVSSSQDCTAKP